MPVNPYEGLQQAAWGGKALTTNTQGGTGGQRIGGKQGGAQGIEAANTTQSGGRMGGRPEQANTSRGEGPAPTFRTLQPPQASSRQNNAAATMGAPDYGGYKTTPAASARKAAFGGNAGTKQSGNGFNITTGDIQIGGAGNSIIKGDGNTVSGNTNTSGATQVSGRDSIMGKRTPGTAGRRRITPIRRTGGPTPGTPTPTAGPTPGPTPGSPAPTPIAGPTPKPGMPTKGITTPIGGAPTPVTPAIGAAPAGGAPTPKAITQKPGTVIPSNPGGGFVEKPQGQLGTGQKAIGAGSSTPPNQTATAGAGPVGKMGGGTDAEQTSNFKGLQGAVSKSATAGGAKEPMNQRGQGSSGMPTAQSTSGGFMANLEKNKAKPSSPTTASAPEPTNASDTKKKASPGLGKRTLEPAGDGTIGPRKNSDGTEDKRQYTTNPSAKQKKTGKGVQPAEIQPNADKEKVKTSAKKKVEKAVSKPPTNASAKKKSKGPVGKMGGGTDAEQTSNFKGLQGAVKKSAKKEEK